jgi:hypothetical protein
MYMTWLWYILGDSFCDPRISRIDKILAKFCPKFLELYSIYGNVPNFYNFAPLAFYSLRNWMLFSKASIA